MSLQEEVNNAVQETEQEVEQKQEVKKEEETFKFGLGNLSDALLTFWASHEGGEELAQKVKMNEYELEAFNEATKPILEHLAEWLKINIEELYALGAVIVIFLPRVSIILQYKKEKAKKEKEEKENEKNGINTEHKE